MRPLASQRDQNRATSSSGSRSRVQHSIKNSRTQELKNSRTQGLKDSRTQELKDSRTQELKNSRTQGLRDSRSQTRTNQPAQVLLKGNSLIAFIRTNTFVPRQPSNNLRIRSPTRSPRDNQSPAALSGLSSNSTYLPTAHNCMLPTAHNCMHNTLTSISVIYSSIFQTYNTKLHA